MKMILVTLAVIVAASNQCSAQGTIRMVSTYQCTVPAASAEADETDSVLTTYATGATKHGTDTTMIVTKRYERSNGRLLEKQVALTDACLEQLGYLGGQRPYFYQYRYDENERLIYYSDYLTGRYQVLDYTDRNLVVKTFERDTRKLIGQEVRSLADGALSKK